MAVQSFGYKRYLPIGNPIHLAENLSRWGVDEIIILDTQRSKKGLGPDIALIEAISKSNVNTPLTYGGGIKSVENAAEVVSAGSERIIIDYLLHSDLDSVNKISNYLGAQALIASLPLRFTKNKSLNWYNHVSRIEKKLDDSLFKIMNQNIVSEVLIIDYEHEGIPNTFNMEIIKNFPIDFPIILFGGLSIKEDLNYCINYPNVVAAAIGNPLNYGEHSLQKLKSKLNYKTIRKVSYNKNSF